MDPVQVVVLLEVLGNELPVRLDLHGQVLVAAPVGQPVAGQALVQVAEPVFYRQRLIRQADEHEALPDRHPDGVEAVVGRVEVVHAGIGELGRGHQVPIQVVAPTVVRAPDR